MKTLRAFSQSNPDSYAVYDPIAKNGIYAKNWNDRIQITDKQTWKSVWFSRRYAYKHGLCEGID